jgi:capsular polysaccharide biosynthesis protein
MPRPSRSFYIVGILLAFSILPLCVGAAYFYTKSLPRVYSSSALVRIYNPSSPLLGNEKNAVDLITEFEVIQSKQILLPAIRPLIENGSWSFKTTSGESFSEDMAYRSFKSQHLRVQPYRNASLIEICCFAEESDKAGAAANAVAQSYIDYYKKNPQHKKQAEVVSDAEFSPRPTRPNLSLNLLLSFVAGLTLTAMCSVALGFCYLFFRPKQTAA